MLEVFIKDRPDLWLGVEKRSAGAGLDVVFRLKATGNYVLHWGLSRRQAGQWQPPPEPVWPEGTHAHGAQAAQTPFNGGNGERQIELHLKPGLNAAYLVFDIFCPETKHWDNNHGRDYYLPLTELKGSMPVPAGILDREIGSKEVAFKKVFPLDSGEDLAVAVERTDERYRLLGLTDAAGPLFLHWGVAERSRSRWRAPSEEIWPAGTESFDEVSVETPFVESQGLRRLEMTFEKSAAPSGISFVLRAPDSGQWLKHRGQNLFVPLAPRQDGMGDMTAIEQQIVDGEMGDHGWTLMHRFNLCHDLIDEVGGQRDGWATLFVWLRYSTIRQLDWQRNYNTKPRELSHAQDRLTLKLAEAYAAHPEQRDLIRPLLGSLGRGGEGQRIRDEILHIMHRHHIKEVGGTWMEQWHQKLHNNTTPDDVVICEAYLAFLRGNGDLNRYREVLGAGGVTEERLASFERPINKNPEWHPHLKDALIYDFENYLKLFKSVHSGTDLETAVNAGGYLLDGSARDAVGFVQAHFRDESTPVTELVRQITTARRRLCEVLGNESNSSRIRDGLYLDLALEDSLRTAVERVVHAGFSGEQLTELTGLMLDNLLLVYDSAELSQCRREWDRLPAQNRFGPDWALHAKAASDRLRQAAQTLIEETYRLLQPKAERLGRAFEADEWTVRLFSEEVVRGRPIFVQTMLLRHLDSFLRKKAKLGDWQIISPSQVVGEVQTAESLHTIQGKRFERPTVIVTERVQGDEEPPEGVRAVITSSSVDLVSHVAVRARNANLLFATCFDGASFERLRSLQGRFVELKTSAAGDVIVAETQAKQSAEKASSQVPSLEIKRAKPSLRVVPMNDFESGDVGGKSLHLKQLNGKLPDWIQVPRSIALPFGVFDAVLADKANTSVGDHYRKLLEAIPVEPEQRLTEIRKCVLELQLPEKLLEDLRKAAGKAGLRCANWDSAATRIKQVWASKWNDRAYFSRQARGWPHEAVQMAVLVQEVVEAEYAFVIHTVNPFTGQPDELYAEAVLGLGETLVGNYPGRAMSFICPKNEGQPKVLAYPAKGSGLFGGGLIFRSDSNAEDLAGYAGAGLYDSVLLEPPREEILDYTKNPLIWDEQFRGEFMGKIAEVGAAVEKAFGAPQDIEGAFCQSKYYVVQTRPQVGLEDSSKSESEAVAKTRSGKRGGARGNATTGKRSAA